MARKTKGESTMTAGTEEEQLAAQERAEETAGAVDAPDIRIEQPGSDKPVAEMSPQEILALLERRRNELSELTSVAKEKGVKVPTKGKPKVSDQDRLMHFFNRIGYSAGMRWWGNSRMLASAERVEPVLNALGDGFDEEKKGEAIEQMAIGFREARIQTSFPSTSMPDKKSAENVPLAEVWGELQARLREDGGPEFLLAMLEDVENTESAEEK